ncbi:MAG: hypothetical protein JWQ87_5340 [Candidatus Sulfotelmatobacter sp.]|nr:hypothetical protein [Candidatus Sulfotelmatobacter sp.]
MNPDSYNFKAECPECETRRSVSCSRAQVKTGQPVKVYSIQCDHNWSLSPEDSKKLRENMTTWEKVK